MTARQAVLDAFSRLEGRTDRDTFRLVELVAEVMATTSEYEESTIRTHIVSVMCANAPIHHSNHTDDLLRVGQGQYRRLAAGESVAAEPDVEEAAPQPASEADRVDVKSEWFWEGNVQATLVADLARSGAHIISVADTESRQHGIDIIATQSGGKILIEVKGYPSRYYARGQRKGEVKKTPAPMQARVWFADALMSSMLNAEEDPESDIVICLPHAATYRSPVERTRTSLAQLGVTLAWVLESGDVEWEKFEVA